MDELAGRMLACQILITGLIARVANDAPDPIKFLSDYRDEVRALVRGIRISGTESDAAIRSVALKTMDEMFSLMKEPGED